MWRPSETIGAFRTWNEGDYHANQSLIEGDVGGRSFKLDSSFVIPSSHEISPTTLVGTCLLRVA